MFSLMAEEYGILVSAKQNLFQMEDYLLQNGRSVYQMTSEERSQYTIEENRQELAGNLVAQSLITMEKFCRYMPLDWVTTTDNGYDFISVFLHLLREDTASLQVSSLACLEAVAIRKLEFGPWFRLVSSLPQAVSEANAAQQEIASRSANASEPHALLVAQFPFHRELSKMLSSLLSAHIAHITNDKAIVSKISLGNSQT